MSKSRSLRNLLIPNPAINNISAISHPPLFSPTPRPIKPMLVLAKGFCSSVFLQGDALVAELLRVHQRFHGRNSFLRAEFHPAKCLTTLNQLNIWKQDPGAN